MMKKRVLAATTSLVNGLDLGSIHATIRDPAITIIYYCCMPYVLFVRLTEYIYID